MKLRKRLLSKCVSTEIKKKSAIYLSYVRIAIQTIDSWNGQNRTFRKHTTMAVLSRRGPIPFLITVIVLLFHVMGEVNAWSPPQSETSLSTSTSRRGFFVGAACFTSIGLMGGANEALAVKPRNEMLCGTGFFTNIWQYKCTDLGDIEDEGKIKTVSAEEEAKMDTLMGKLSMAGGESPVGKDTGSTKVDTPKSNLSKE
jgi:hypothetical protein